MISAPRAWILTDADRAGGTSYKPQEEMKPMISFFFPVEYITTSICKLICNIIICCFCHRSAARVLGQRPWQCHSPASSAAVRSSQELGGLCVCAQIQTGWDVEMHVWTHVCTCVCAYTHVHWIHTWMCLCTHARDKYTCTYKNEILYGKIKLYLRDGYCREEPADCPAACAVSKPQRITGQKSWALLSSLWSFLTNPKPAMPASWQHYSLTLKAGLTFFFLINLLLLLLLVLFMACHVEDYGQ